VIREATKLFEEIVRGVISDAIERFTAAKPRGEITIVVAGTTAEAPGVMPEQIEEALTERLKSGMSSRDAIREVTALYPTSRKTIYRRAIEIKEGSRNEQ
jgi:16S rRNA (cytidine1402-2'-O)-methyltransferase